MASEESTKASRHTLLIIDQNRIHNVTRNFRHSMSNLTSYICWPLATKNVAQSLAALARRRHAKPSKPNGLTRGLAIVAAPGAKMDLQSKVCCRFMRIMDSKLMEKIKSIAPLLGG